MIQSRTREDGHSANGISDTDNKGKSSKADISSSLNSTSSNDNRSVGKVGTNGNLSDAVTGGISPQQNYSRQSVGNPSSMQEANAKQNEGEHNTYPQHLAGGQTQQSNGSNANGYKANATITAINRHKEAYEPPYRQIIPKDD